MKPSLAAHPIGVALVGEALGQQEAELGSPFVGRAGFKLTRLIEWAGFRREDFDIWNTVWCRPPLNLLEGQAYEKGAIDWCRSHHWGSLIDRARVIVPMGNVPLGAFTGRKGILSTRGYVRPGPASTYLVPTVHPSFIQRGFSKWSAAFIHDLQKAVELSLEGLPVQITDYILDPSPRVALEQAQSYRRRLAAGEPLRLAFDIETPYKGSEEEENDAEDPSYQIDRIGFSWDPFHAITFPFAPEYMAAIRLFLEGNGEKVVWNAPFDCPRIRSYGIGINGVIHDGMVAWHILHSDLPKSLGFVATFTCPWQQEWKGMSSKDPLYNAIDNDVELRSFLHIEAELRRTGLWDVYQRDVLDLEPILLFMSEKGMPVDTGIRLDRATKLADLQKQVGIELAEAVPIAARRWTPKEGYTREPIRESEQDYVEISVGVNQKRCSGCGAPNPPKAHFKTRKKVTKKYPQNPCATGAVVVVPTEIKRWAKLEPFRPSREQLMRYQEVMGRPTPTQWDKKAHARKPSMNEKAIKELLLKYPTDRVYKGVLEWRKLDKLAGNYIGRVREVPCI